MFASHNNKSRSAFITATIAALLIAFSPNLHVQSSPLTAQPSTGRVGVGTTNPSSALEVSVDVVIGRPGTGVWLPDDCE